MKIQFLTSNQKWCYISEYGRIIISYNVLCYITFFDLSLCITKHSKKLCLSCFIITTCIYHSSMLLVKYRWIVLSYPGPRSYKDYTRYLSVLEIVVMVWKGLYLLLYSIALSTIQPSSPAPRYSSKHIFQDPGLPHESKQNKNRLA